MVTLIYPLLSPIRLLLPFAAIFMILPCIFKKELMNYFAFPIFYFFGSYFIFINFPSIPQVLYSKPTYIDDLVIVNNKQSDESFKKIYTVVMSFILAILFAVFSEYIIIQGVNDRPIIELLGIIGGNLGLYMKAQVFVGKITMFFCYKIKEKNKRKLSDHFPNPEI